MENKRSYYAIIPGNVRYDKRLTANAKLLYGEITALCNERGYCWASNAYFAELYEVSRDTVSRWIRQLAKYNYISIDLTYKSGSKEIDCRFLRLTESRDDIIVNTPPDKKVIPSPQKRQDPPCKNVKDNITVNNTDNIYSTKKFTAPSLEDIRQYIRDNKYNVDANIFYKYFTEGDWKDRDGKPVKNWKQKIITWHGRSGGKRQETEREQLERLYGG